MDFPWTDFVNSDERDYRGRDPRQDRLDDPQWLRRFLDRWELGRINVRSPRTRSALRELRELLQRLIRALAEGRPLGDRSLDELNRYLEARPVLTRLKRQAGALRIQLVSTARGPEAVLFGIATSFAEFLVEGDPSRLKLCENPDCAWVFYDTTRSRTRRWCADNCGNLMKVRKFRQRKKKAASRRRRTTSSGR